MTAHRLAAEDSHPITKNLTVASEVSATVNIFLRAESESLTTRKAYAAGGCIAITATVSACMTCGSSCWQGW